MSSQGLTVRLGQLEIFAEETGKGSPTLVIAALNVKDVVLVGHSMGGKIAQIVAGRRLEGLRAVVVPQARFETLEGVGHLSPLEAPG